MSNSFCETQARVHKEMYEGMGHLSRRELREVIYAGVFEEAGEIAGIHKREHRRFDRDLEELTMDHLMEEIGDLLWYIFALCDIENISVCDVMEYNKQKLEARYGQHKSSETL